MRRRFPTRVTQRDIKNALIGLDALHNGTTPEFIEPTRRSSNSTPKRQAESSVNDVVKVWARTKAGELYRNARGMMPTPNGGMRPYGLGPNGAGDLIGPMPVTITPDMVGRVISVYCELESKTPIGRVQQHQLDRIARLRDMGAMAGVVRSIEDADDVYRWWHSKGTMK